jgi:hypothetical protein
MLSLAIQCRLFVVRKCALEDIISEVVVLVHRHRKVDNGNKSCPKMFTIALLLEARINGGSNDSLVGGE